jgi:cell wall assembly regulator SMI1
VDIEAVGRAMAADLRDAAGAGGSWAEAGMRVALGEGGFQIDGWTDSAAGVRAGAGELIDLLFQQDGPALVEVRLLADGSYTAHGTEDVRLVRPDVLVFDPGYRYPNHPAPGMDRPATARPTGAATDPAVLAEVRDLVVRFVDGYTARKGAPPRCLPGAGEEELAAAEERLGVRLPEDLRALYTLIGGDPEQIGLLGTWSHNPLDQLVGEFEQYGPGCGNTGGDLDEPGVVYESAPFERVRRLARNDFWRVFGSDRAMNFLAVDLDPAPGGRYGQVLALGRDVTGPMRYVAASVTEILREVVAALDAGHVDEHPDEPFLIIEVPTGEVTDSRHSAGVTTLDAVDHPELVQELYWNDAGNVDLAALQAFPALRRLSINRATTVRTAPLSTLESLEITGGQVDLSGLVDSTTLWSLQLTDLAAAPDLAVLATLPNLQRLTVTTPTTPPDLPTLRVLGVDAAAITHLSAAAKPLPNLAALLLSRGTRLPLPEAVRLSQLLRPDHAPPALHQASGRLP